MNSSRFLRNVLPVLAWMIVIFSLSTHVGSATHTDSFLNSLLARFFPHLWHRMTWPEIDALHYYVRKAAHVTEYAILGVLMLRAIRAYQTLLTRRLIFIAWFLCTLYAATDEFHQIFVSGRTPKVTDVLLDAVGAAFGVALCYLFVIRRSPRSGASHTIPSLLKKSL